MGLGLLQYLRTGSHLGTAGLNPATPASPEVAHKHRRTLIMGIAGVGILAVVLAFIGVTNPELMTRANITTGFTVVLLTVVVAFFARLFLGGDWTASERSRLLVIFVLFCASAVFWGVFEQAGSTLTLFAERSTNNSIFGFNFDSSWWQSVNAALIVILAPFFSWLWIRLGRNNPGYAAKFGIGLLFAGLGFLWLVGGAYASENGAVGIHWLLGVYLMHTIGELFLSPVGLSSMTKLAPERAVGMMMGVWFLASSVGNFLGGTASGFYEALPLPRLFMMVGLSAVVMALVMFVLTKPVKKMLAAGGLTPGGEPVS
jgi:POT family proton-dependent oligopeptide transporter